MGKGADIDEEDYLQRNLWLSASTNATGASGRWIIYDTTA